MTTDTTHRLHKFNHAKLDAIIEELDLPEELAAQLSEHDSDFEMIETLRNAQEYTFALKLLALGLPTREAIWWALISIQESVNNTGDEPQVKLLQVIEQWVKDPQDELRRKLGAVADRAGLYTPTAWLAQAVFWSSGSIAPVDETPIQSEEFMCQHAVFNAIQFATKQMDDKPNYYEYTLKRGLHIAMGGNGKIEKE